MKKAPSQVEHDSSGGHVASYKTMLATIIDRRPSGTRQRLATALSKNRSFVSQIVSPAYSTPIPPNHLEVIFEICRFSAREKRDFLDLYSTAHPNRLSPAQGDSKLRAQTFYLPDLENEELNVQIHALITDFVRQVSELVKASNRGGKGS